MQSLTKLVDAHAGSPSANVQRAESASPPAAPRVRVATFAPGTQRLLRPPRRESTEGGTACHFAPSRGVTNAAAAVARGPERLPGALAGSRRPAGRPLTWGGVAARTPCRGSEASPPVPVSAPADQKLRPTGAAGCRRPLGSTVSLRRCPGRGQSKPSPA